MDEEQTSKPDFNKAAALEEIDKATDQKNEQLAEQERETAALRETERHENAADITQRPEQEQEQNQVAADAPGLDYNPPEQVEDRSAEQANISRENAAQQIREAAESREEMFNRHAQGEQVSPYLQDDPEQNQSQGDDDISH